MEVTALLLIPFVFVGVISISFVVVLALGVREQECKEKDGMRKWIKRARGRYNTSMIPPHKEPRGIARWFSWFKPNSDIYYR